MKNYEVQPTDTLSKIAKQFKTTTAKLREANSDRIRDSNFIMIGWKLRIPEAGDLPLTGEPAEPGTIGSSSTGDAAHPAGGDSHTVVAGDSVSVLAQLWGTTEAAIVALNHLPDANTIFIGQELKMPGGAPAADAGEPSSGQPLVDRLPPPPGELRFDCLPLAVPPATVTGTYRELYSNANGTYLHLGIDIAAPIGTEIRAPAGGVVTVRRVGDGQGFESFGNSVVINHRETDYWSIYAHMSETALQSGDVVKAGDVLGLVGFTGFVDPPNANGAHLHWQVSDNVHFPKAEARTRDPKLFFASGVFFPSTEGLPAGFGPGSMGTCGDALEGTPVPKKLRKPRKKKATPVR